MSFVDMLPVAQQRRKFIPALTGAQDPEAEEIADADPQEPLRFPLGIPPDTIINTVQAAQDGKFSTPPPVQAVAQQGAQQSGDVGEIPVSERMQAVMDAGGVNAPSSTTQQPAQTAQTAPPAAQPRPKSEVLNDAYQQIAATPAKDRNGRLKSGLPQALYQIGQNAQAVSERAMRTGRPVDAYDLASIAGGGLGGAIAGGINPALDEERKRQMRMADLQGQIQQQVQIERIQAQSAGITARAEAQAAQSSPDAIASVRQPSNLKEASRRLRLMGGTYTPGKDQTLDALVQSLGISPKQKTAGGFNPNNLKVVGGNLVYVEHPDLPPVVLYTAGMNEADRQRNAIALEQVKAYRKRNGDPPLMFAADLEGGTAPQVNQSTTQQPTASQPPSALGITARPQANVTQQPEAAAQPSQTPSGIQPRSVLVTVPGAKATPPLGIRARGRGNYSRTTSAGGQSRSDQIAASLDARDAANYTQQAANARAQAAAARARGEDEVAAQYENAARVADENARKVGQRRGASQTAPAPKKGDPLGILD